MKKILALILCVLMTLSFGAVAEEQTASAWHVVVDGMELTFADETIVFAPTFEGTFGTDANGLWGEGSVLLNGEKILSIQGTYVNDEICITADGAQDCLSLSGINALITELTGEELDLSVYMPMMLVLLEDTSWIDELATSLEGTGAAIEQLGDYDYNLSYALEGEAMKVHVAWEAVDASALDLSAKNNVVLDLNEDLPENDVVDAVLAGFSKLMDDASVQQLMALAESLEDEINLEDLEGELAAMEESLGA